MPTAQCRRCSKDFQAAAGRAIYCQQACYVADLRDRASASLIARFWAKVNKTQTCWLWQGAKGDRFGHGAVAYRPEGQSRQVHVYAHRFSWTLTHGPIPDNLSVLHACDVPACVNPNHLFLGTQSDNLTDARQKGRLVDGRHLIKVSDAGIADIRAHYRPRHNGKQLAAQYGITLISLLRIVNGTQRVSRSVFERVPSVQLPILGEVA